MLNFGLMKHWQNWLVIFLMVAIPLVAFHPLVSMLDTDDK